MTDFNATRAAARIPAAFVALFCVVAPAAAEPGFPTGWSGGSRRMQDYDFGTAPMDGANSGRAAYIRARPDAQSNLFFSMTQCVDAAAYVGGHLRFSGRLKTVNANTGQLWMRVDQDRAAVQFDNMNDRSITGTADWQRKDIVLSVPARSTRICFGFMLGGGQGEIWADDLKLEGVPFAVPATSSAASFGSSGGWMLSHGGLNRLDDR